MTVEEFKTNPKFQNLDTVVLTEMESVFKNFLQVKIDENRSTWWDMLDKDVESITGQKKPAGETKSYQHLKNVLTDLKAKAEGARNTTALQQENDSLKTKNAELEKKIKEGSTDGALKAQLAQLEKTIQDKNSEIGTLKSGIETTKTDHEKALNELRNQNNTMYLTSAFDRATTEKGVKFKKTYGEKELEDILNYKREKLLSTLKVDRINVDGKEQTVLRNSSGEIIRTQGTAAPTTPGELYLKEIAPYIDTGRQQRGAGTKTGEGGKGGGAPVDVSTAKTKTEATDMIQKGLFDSGLAVTDPKFQEAFDKAYAENKETIDALPLGAST